MLSAQGPEDATQGAGVEAIQAISAQRQVKLMSRWCSLVFCQVLIKLYIPPHLAPLVDRVNIKLGRLDPSEV